jgi:molecular chaperone IbpA
MDFRHTFLPKELDRFFVGFDPLVKRLAEATEQATKLAQNYPPYNIKKVDENKYVIEIAVAGFGKQDLEIEFADDKLIVKGHTQSGEIMSEGTMVLPQFIYQGLAMRPFTRTFTLADNVEIAGCSLVNGILKIALEAIIPEHKKPKKIDIQDTVDSKEFLTESKGK